MKSLGKHGPVALALMGAIAAAPAVDAQNYPTRPIRWIVPVPAGATTDIVTRLVAQKINEAWGQQVIVDNRPGGAFVIGSDIVAKGVPDGHTIGTLLTPHIVNPYVMKDLPYDAIGSFDHVSMIAETWPLCTVGPNVPARNLKELADYIKANPGKYNYGSPGSGSPAHLTVAQISQQTGNSMVYVPFKGTAPLALSMLAGDVQITTYSLTVVAGHLKAGKMRALAVTSKQRMAEIPDVPTTAEAGFPQYSGTNWWVIAAPRGTNTRIIDRLWAEFRTALADPEVRKRIAETGHVPIPQGPAETVAFLKSESARYKKIVEDGNITAQ